MLQNVLLEICLALSAFSKVLVNTAVCPEGLLIRVKVGQSFLAYEGTNFRGGRYWYTGSEDLVRLLILGRKSQVVLLLVLKHDAYRYFLTIFSSLTYLLTLRQDQPNKYGNVLPNLRPNLALNYITVVSFQYCNRLDFKIRVWLAFFVKFVCE